MAAIIQFAVHPLTTWFTGCVEDTLLGVGYHDIIDGVLLHKIFLKINPEPVHDKIIASGGDPAIRTKNLERIVQNIKNYYEEKLGHVLLQIPDAKALGEDPEMHTEDAKLLLLLLLGAAVQCPNKEKFIKNIYALRNDAGVSRIKEYIKKVTESQEIVLTREYVETNRTGSVFSLLRKLVQNQNMLVEKQPSVERAERLEAEVAKYREKLNDLEYYKSRTRELIEEREVLIETKVVLEEQLAAQMERTSTIDDLHEELENYKQAIKEIRENNSETYQKYNILREENAHLRSVNKELLSSCSSSTDTASECEDMVMNESLSEELNFSVQSRSLTRQPEYHRQDSVSPALEEYENEDEAWKIMTPDLYRHHRSTSRSQVNVEQMKSKCAKLEASVFLLESQNKKLQCDVQTFHEIINENELKLRESKKKCDNLSKQMKENEASCNSEVHKKLQICLEILGLDANTVMKLTNDGIVDTITKNFTRIITVKKEISDATDFTNQEIIDDMNVNINYLRSTLVSVQSESEYHISENVKLRTLLSSMDLSLSTMNSEKADLQTNFSSMTISYATLINDYRYLQTEYRKLLHERDTLSTELLTLSKTLENGDVSVVQSEMDYE